jgi:serine/threonine protein kinase
MNSRYSSDDRTLFDAEMDQLLDLAPEARALRLIDIEAQNPERAQHLRAWLHAIEQSEGAFESPSIKKQETPQRIGPWRVLHLIGRGGMGEVYLGERADGAFVRKVAIKFLRQDRTPTSKQLGRERHVLARLRHPGIAQLLDGGVTPDNRPYLVMEWVDGTSFDVWVKEKNPNLRTRVTVLKQAAEAVAYAHANLVVHRDLKPDNVMVDQEGLPRLLDFGIARLLEESNDNTLTDDRALTPAIAAPEQFTGQAISTKTDVYALGGLLYCLISGQMPHDTKNLALVDLIQKVCHTDPPAPSSLIKNKNTKVSADLDAIALKALAREPEKRYASAEAMAQDLDRWLKGETVSARLPTRWERTQRFIKHNKLVVGLTTAVFASLLSGIVSTLWQVHEAALERDEALSKADQGGAFVGNLGRLFRNSESEEKRTASEWLDLAVKQADSAGFFDEKEKAIYLKNIADIEFNRTQLARANSLYQRIITHHSSVIDDAIKANILCKKSWALANLGQYTEANKDVETGIAIAKNLHGSKRSALIECLMFGTRISPTYSYDRKINTERLELAFSELTRFKDQNNQEPYMALLSIKADHQSREGLYTEALKTYMAIYNELARNNQKLGVDAIEFQAMLYTDMARLFDKLGHLRIADAFFAAALKEFEAQQSNLSPSWKRHYAAYGRLCARRGDYAQSIDLLQNALKLYQRSDHLRPREQAMAYEDLGIALGQQGLTQEAKLAFKKAEIIYQTAPDQQERYAYIGMLRAELALKGNQRDLAQQEIMPVVSFYRTPEIKLPNNIRQINLSRALQVLAKIEIHSNLTLAETHAREALSIERANEGSSQALVAISGLVLADILIKTNRRSEAIRLLAKALVTLELSGHRYAHDARALWVMASKEKMPASEPTIH